MATVKEVPKSNTAFASSMSTNQMRIYEIRNFMDRSEQQYYRQQEMTKNYNQVLERKKAEAEVAAAAAAKETATTEATSKL